MNEEDAELLDAILEDWQLARQPHSAVALLDRRLLREDNARAVIAMLPADLLEHLERYVSSDWNGVIWDEHGPLDPAQAERHRRKMLYIASILSNR